MPRADHPTFAHCTPTALHTCSICGAVVEGGISLRTHVAWHAQQDGAFGDAVTRLISLYNVATKVPRVKDYA